MDYKENATSCPVCQEIYTDPRSLACGHSFCLQCLKGVAGNKQTFPCPICRFDVDLRYTNVDQLPKNYVLCIVIEALDKNTTSMCLDHNKSLDLFCQRCGVVICSKCLTMQHKGHDIEDIEQIYTERNKQLVAFLESTNHLTSMTKAKSDAVKQSRILMEKNTDSVSKTVEKTFKKWNDALQKQHHSIASYVYQERNQKRKVCLDAEGILADLMNTLTGLETDINRLRSKDTVVVVQQFGSIKTRQEDTERKVLQDIETCFTPPDNLVIEIYAPWIEEAINNIKHIDMKQTQARLVPQTIAAIQEENAILKRELSASKQDKIKSLKTLEAQYETLQNDHTNVIRQYEIENQCMDSLIQSVHEHVVSGAESSPATIAQLAQIKPESSIAKRYQHAKEICAKYTQVENGIKELQDKSLVQGVLMSALDDYVISMKQNSFEIPSALQLGQTFDLEYGQAKRIAQTFEEKERELSASKQKLEEMANKKQKYEQKYEKLKTEHQNLDATCATLQKQCIAANAQLSGFKKDMERRITYYEQNSQKKAMSSQVTETKDYEMELLNETQSFHKKQGSHQEDAVEDIKVTEETQIQSEIEDLHYQNQCMDTIIQFVYDHVSAESSPGTIEKLAEIKSESLIANRYKHAKEICVKYTETVNGIKELQDKSLLQGVLMSALDEYVTSKKPNSFEIPSAFQLDQKFDLEYGQAKRIAQSFEEKTRELSASKQKLEEMANKNKEYEQKYETLKTEHQNLDATCATLKKQCIEANAQLSGFKKDMERRITYYEQKLAKEVKSKEDIDANLKKTKQDLNEKIKTLKTLQAKYETLQSDHTKAVNQLREINREKSILEDTYIKMQQKMVDMDDKYQRMIEQKNHEITRLRQSEENLLTRLSKFAGDRFTHDNVNIADLSDADRPTKLSETYSELYDNEWTDAFEELTEDMKLSDEAAIRFLLKILMNAFYKCKEITWDRYESLKLVASTIEVHQETLPPIIPEEKQNPTANKSEVVTDGQQEEENEEADTNISENPITNKSEVVTDGQQEEENEEADTNISEPPTANLSDGTTSGQQEEETEPAGTNTSELCMQSTSRTLTLSSDQEKSLKHMWRSTTINIKDESLKLLCANLLTCLGKPETEMPKTAKYLRCCTELCWKMGVQEKPMHLNVNAEKQAGQEKRFDTDKFRAYTKTGKYVAYVVLPALLLHEGGAMLAKGIAQGCQERVSSKE